MLTPEREEAVQGLISCTGSSKKRARADEEEEEEAHDPASPSASARKRQRKRDREAATKAELKEYKRAAKHTTPTPPKDQSQQQHGQCG
jgi:hypothetical protein